MFVFVKHCKETLIERPLLGGVGPLIAGFLFIVLSTLRQRLCDMWLPSPSPHAVALTLHLRVAKGAGGYSDIQ